MLFIGDWVGTESTRLESIVRVSRTEAQRRGAVVSWCDASQSVGARTLRPPTVQTTFPAVGDRVSSHDHQSAFGHTVDRPADPVVRELTRTEASSRNRIVRWRFVLFFDWQFCADISARFGYLRDVGVWLREHCLAVICRSRKLFCKRELWYIWFAYRCRTFSDYLIILSCLLDI